MAQGLKSYAGMAVPLYGESTIKGQTAADDTLTIQQPASHAAAPLVVKNSSSSNVWGLSSTGMVRTQVLGSLAVGSMATNSTYTYSVTGITTADVVQLYIKTGLVSGEGTFGVQVSEADKIMVFPTAALTVAAKTCAVAYFRTISS
jgi:hypothetical protein